MLQCCQNILIFTEGKDINSFLNDPVTIRAVAFELITLGEAVRSLPGDIKEANPHIPWAAIQGIRNILVHEYYRLDEEVIWETVTNDIPNLITGLEKLS